MKNENKVLACVDQSRYADYVADCAAWAAHRMNAPLEFLHVIDSHPERGMGDDRSGAIGIDAQESLLAKLSAEDETRAKSAREQGRLFLNRLRERAMAIGATDVDVRQRHGDLEETVVEQAKGVRLLVLGRRGADAATSQRSELGHHVEHMVRALNRPILTVTEDFKAPQRVLFDRDRRGTRLTPAGTVFLQDVRRLFTVLDQARENVKAVAAGLNGSLRIAISDGTVDQRLSAFLADCREEEPEIEIRLSEVPLAEQIRGLRSGDFTIGFAHTADVENDIVAEPIWRDPLVIAVPARHELLAHKEVPLQEIGDHPLVLCDPRVCEGYCRELSRLLRPLEREPNIVGHASSLDMMLTLVGAGYGLGFTTAARLAVSRRADVVARPLAVDSAVITTYLLRPRRDTPSPPLERFIARLRSQVDG